MPAQTVIKLRRDTAANWTTANPTLAAGEPGLETDTLRLKFGDGTTAWTSLAYVAEEISAYDFIGFDTSKSVAVSAGQLAWNAAEETLDIGLNADVTLQVGQEQLIRVKNMTGVEIPNGTAVQFAGVNGDQIQVAPAVADGSVDHHYMMGVTTEAILHGESGFVTTSGLVRGLATDGYGIAGTILYIDPATPGGLTATVPTAPNLKCPVAAVTKSGPGTSGILMVRMEMGENLADLHDVNIDATLAHGQVLQYQAATGRWENGTIDLSSKQDVVSGVSSTEISYLANVTSDIQGQLDDKAPLAQTMETVSTSRALTDADSGKILLVSNGITITTGGLNSGERVDFINQDGSTITFAPGGMAILASKDSATTLSSENGAATIVCWGPDMHYYLIGDIA